jgi:type IV pilus assembly protein PilW
MNTQIASKLAYNAARWGRRQRGFSLVELMISLVIGVILVYGAVRLLVDSRNTQRASDSTASVQEIATYALAVLEPDVRLASYWGKTNRADLVSGATASTSSRSALDTLVAGNCGVNFTVDLAQYLQATDGTYGLACAAQSFVGDTDVLVVRHASAEVTALAAGALQLQSGVMRGQLFADGERPSGYGAPPSTVTHNVEVNAYYVGTLANNVDGQPQWALRRKRLTSAGGAPTIIDEEVVRGVQDLQVELGFDTSDDGAADVYVNPGSEPADGSLVAVRLSLLVASEERDQGHVESTAYTLANRTHAVYSDARHRRVVVRTISLRNTTL